jgi:hypothetical protein
VSHRPGRVGADLTHLPAALRKRPDIRALELRVYDAGPRHYQVPGREKIYDVYVVDGATICTCTAASFGRECAHAIAVGNYLKEKPPNGNRERPPR